MQKLEPHPLEKILSFVWFPTALCGEVLRSIVARERE